nr:hypothetical protein [Tanacetum cinerariifolium]
MIDQVLLRNSGGGDGSHSSHVENPRNMHTTRPCYYDDFMKCHPLNFKGTEGAVGLTRWIEKMESVFNFSGCAVENQKLRTYAKRKSDSKRKVDDISRNNQQPFKKQNVAKEYNLGSAKKNTYEGNAPKCTKCQRNHSGPGNRCFECGNLGHFKRDCPKLKNKDGGNRNAQGWVYAVGNVERNGNATGNSDSNVITDLMPVELGSFDAIISMDWLRRHHTVIVCDEKLVRVPFGNKTLFFCGAESYIRRESRLTVISCSKVQEYMAKGCHVFLAQISATKEDDKPERKQVKDVPIVQDFLEVFPEDFPGLPPARPSKVTEKKLKKKRLEDVPVIYDFPEVFPNDFPGLPPLRQVEFRIDLLPGAALVARAPYRLAPFEMRGLSVQLQELLEK